MGRKILFWGFLLGTISTVWAEAPPALLSRGKSLYQQQCAVCHGVEGKGDGKAAYLLFPKPRDFTQGLYKLRSTPSGQVPTDQDLFTTVSRGIPGSAMPSFVSLAEKERWALVSYLKSLATVEMDGKKANLFQVRGAPTEVQVFPEPPITPDSLAKGKQLYDDLGCATCHGSRGEGDGPAVQGLTDSWGYPIPAADLTQKTFKGGSTGQDIYLRLATGMDGTPMPAFGDDVISGEERWMLVYYIKSLGKKPEGKRPGTGAVVSKRTTQVILLDDPTSPLWNQAPATEIPLMRLYQRPQPPGAVTVKSLHNDRDIAFLLEWQDSGKETDFLRSEDFRDAVAIQFALSQEAPSFTMGEKGKPVNIWQWKADWQADLESFHDMEGTYPDMAVDLYPFQEEEGVLFLAGRAAKNLLSLPRRQTAVEDINAEGFGTLTSQPFEHQNVRGKGFWRGGRWQVIFVRALSSAEAGDVTFQPGEKLPIAFAVWDGAAGDRNGQKAVTTWYTVEIER